jgi:hypothetical protein
VLYTRGSPQLWRLTFAAGRAVNPANAASQHLDPSAGRRTVRNKAEYVGDKLWVAAGGTYQPLQEEGPGGGGGSTLPVRVRASITSGAPKWLLPGSAHGPGWRAVARQQQCFTSSTRHTTCPPCPPPPPTHTHTRTHEGALHVLGTTIPLPIRGTGVFDVVYLGPQLRVFRSGGALAVQVREAFLQQQGLL